MTESITKETADKKSLKPHFWVASTYFGEGFPYSIVQSLADIFLKESGASLEVIGLTSLFHLPWNIKFLWAVYIDRYATKRAWILAVEIFIIIVLSLMALSLSLPNYLQIISIFFVILAFLSATHDIAIDGFYMEALDNENQSKFVGYRAMAYRLSMLFVSGPIVLWINYFQEHYFLGKNNSVAISWQIGFITCAIVMALLLAIHKLLLPKNEIVKLSFYQLFRDFLNKKVVFYLSLITVFIIGIIFIKNSDVYIKSLEYCLKTMPQLKSLGIADVISLLLLCVLIAIVLFFKRIHEYIKTHPSNYALAFLKFMEQPKVINILAFVILFRTGESFLLKMRYPFLRDIGMSMEDIGLASGTIGLIFSFSATLIGGRLISKHGIEKWIWPFTIAQNLLHILYTLLAYYAEVYHNDGITKIPFYILTSVVSLEAVGGGLGTAVLMVYIMRCCHQDYKAAHAAILTALMSLSFTFAGVASGVIASSIGYQMYFLFTIIISLPSMFLIPTLPYLANKTP